MLFIKKGYLFGYVLCFIALILVTKDYRVYAFESYEMTSDNDFQLSFKQKKAEETATYRYKTGNWYLHKVKTQGASQYLTADDYNGMLLLKTTRIPELTTEPDSDGIYWETRQLDAAQLMSWILENYTKEELIRTNGQLKVYASRSLRVEKDGADIGKEYYCYQSMESALDEWEEMWSDAALNAIKNSYDREINLQLSFTTVITRALDTESGKILSISTEKYFYGETVIKQAQTFSGYSYEGYSFSTENGNIVESTEEKSEFSRILRSGELGKGVLTLSFLYREKQNEGTLTPEATKAPEEPTPTPTAVTTKFYQKTDAEHRYYSTDEGYTLEKISDGMMYLASYQGKTSGGLIKENEAASRGEKYLVGTDSRGNSWYFIADGENAVYVHPKTYGTDSNKYEVKSEDIKYIVELTFPEIIFCGKESYIVRTIGGSMETYHSVEEDEKITGSAYTKTIKYQYDMSHGSYVYCYEYATYTYYSKISYQYGVLGNGKIESVGENIRETKNGAGHYYLYENNYYVYNTTLLEVTIPDTVTEILPYAFLYCEALHKINGGEYVEKIGESAFRSAVNKNAELSEEWETAEEGQEEKRKIVYYYNGSYSQEKKTLVMQNWEKAVEFSLRLLPPEFSGLVRIGEYAFAYHENLDEIAFTDKTAQIENGAFLGCRLEQIKVPAVTMIGGGEDTLGTKGNVQEKTVIYTEPGAESVIAYGREYSDYYCIKCGYTVTYHPNEGTGNLQTSVSVLEDKSPDIVDGGVIYADFNNGIDSVAAVYFFIDKDGFIFLKKGEKLEKINVQATPEHIYFNDNSVLVFQQADGTLWKMHYQNKTIKVTLLQLLHSPEKIEKIVGSTTGSIGIYYETADGCQYYYWITADGTEKETLKKRAAEEGTIDTTFYYEGYHAGQNKERKAYYWNGTAWKLLSTARYPSETEIKAIWSTGYVTKTYDEYLDEYTESEINVYHAVDGNGNIRTRREGLEEWELTESEISSEVCYAKELYCDHQCSISLIQEENGIIHYMKTNSPDDTLSECQSKTVCFGKAEAKIQKTYALYGSDGEMLFYIELENGAFYWITDSLNMRSPLPEKMNRMAGELVYFEKLVLYHIGEFTTEEDFLSYTIENSAVIGLAKDGSLWASGHDVWGALGIGESVESVTKNNYTTMQNVSNGRKYRDIAVKVTESVSYEEEVFVSGKRDWQSTYALGEDGILYGTGKIGQKGTTLGIHVNSWQAISEVQAVALINHECTVTMSGCIFHTTNKIEEYEADAGYFYSATVLPNLFFQRQGYIYAGWNDEADGSGNFYEPGTKLILTDHLVLYAVWEKKASVQQQKFEITDTTDIAARKILSSGIQALILKKGYHFTYKISLLEGAFADEVESVRILADYFLISAEEAKRKEVCVYYTVISDGEKYCFVRAGSEMDQRNGQSNGIIHLTQKESDACWIGEFSLPTELYVVEKEKQKDFEWYKQRNSISGEEEFFIKEGYLGVRFTIEFETASGMSVEFKQWEETKLYSDMKDAGWNCKAGDVIRYDLGLSSAQDYVVGGVE